MGLVHEHTHTHTHTKLSLPGPGLLWRLAVLFCRWPWCWSLGACWWPCFCACWCAWEHWQMPILPNQRTRVKTLLPKSWPSTTPPWDTTSTWSPGRGRNAHTDQQPGPEHWKHTRGCRSLTITLGATALLVQNVSKQWYQKKKDRSSEKLPNVRIYILLTFLSFHSQSLSESFPLRVFGRFLTGEVHQWSS